MLKGRREGENPFVRSPKKRRFPRSGVRSERLRRRGGREEGSRKLPPRSRLPARKRFPKRRSGRAFEKSIVSPERKRMDEKSSKTEKRRKSAGSRTPRE